MVKLIGAVRQNNSLLCVGLDPYPELMPVKDVFGFNKKIIEATCDLVCAYKLNLGFYEALGLSGIKALKKTLAFIPGELPVIGDGKRGDIGTASQAYARALFEELGFDAVTVNPYMGFDSVAPFLSYPSRGIFVLCRTSNPGADDFQPAIFEKVALKAREWNRNGNVGLVVGATFPRDMARLRELCPELWFLIPGVGVQGGELELAVSHGRNALGDGFIINVSRAVIYSSKGKDFAQRAREAALRFRDEINRLRHRDKAGGHPQA